MTDGSAEGDVVTAARETPLATAVANESTQGERSQSRKTAPKASTLLADELRRMIVRGRLDEGAPFASEGELIDRSGLSRATVRESLRLLEAEGLLVPRRGPGGGLRVGRPDLNSTVQSIAVHLALSEASLGDLFALRRVLERESARLAATHATPEQIRQLEASVSDAPAPLPDVVNFHDLIAEATGNEFFRVMLKVVVSLAAWHTPDEGLEERDLRFARAAHAKVVARIVAGDPDGAGRAMDVHLEAFENLVRDRGNIDQPVIRSAEWGADVAGQL